MVLSFEEQRYLDHVFENLFDCTLRISLLNKKKKNKSRKKELEQVQFLYFKMFKTFYLNKLLPIVSPQQQKELKELLENLQAKQAFIEPFWMRYTTDPFSPTLFGKLIMRSATPYINHVEKKKTK